jgi:hypothetical protein
MSKKKMEYLFCEDWMIYAKDEAGQIYCVVTECWPEWSQFPESAAYEPNAVEKYMLPIAKAKWDKLSWRDCYANVSQINLPEGCQTCQKV